MVFQRGSGCSFSLFPFPSFSCSLVPLPLTDYNYTFLRPFRKDAIPARLR